MFAAPLRALQVLIPSVVLLFQSRPAEFLHWETKSLQTAYKLMLRLAETPEFYPLDAVMPHPAQCEQDCGLVEVELAGQPW
jgi:hypothetical protein